MDRLFVWPYLAAALLAALLMLAPAHAGDAGAERAQPVFFSMLFPHLIPGQGDGVLGQGDAWVEVAWL